MPYARKTYKKKYAPRRTKTNTTRKYAKRKYTRRNTNNRGVVKIANTRPTIQRGYLPFGVQYFAKLPYVENFAISAAGTTGLSTTQFTFYSNNVYDPRVETGGHQPLQYDILTSHYERVWVWGAAVELTFANPTHDGMYVGYRCRAHTNPVLTHNQALDYIQEMRDSAIRPLNNTGKQSTTFKFYISNPKLIGISKGQYNNIEYSHITSSGGPQVHGRIEPYALHSVSGETAVVRCNIKITYYCQFTNSISESQN